jgi:hypothetical protein
MILKDSVSNAALTCSSMNMSLLAIDSISKLACLFKLIPKGIKENCGDVYERL